MLFKIIKLIYDRMLKTNPVENKPIEKIKETAVKETPVKKTPVIKQKDGLPTEEFKFGMNHAWIMIQLSMFKMYKENDILDYDSLFSAVAKNVELISEDINSLKKWNEEFIEYIQSKDQFEAPNIEDL